MKKSIIKLLFNMFQNHLFNDVNNYDYVDNFYSTIGYDYESEVLLRQLGIHSTNMLQNLFIDCLDNLDGKLSDKEFNDKWIDADNLFNNNMNKMGIKVGDKVTIVGEYVGKVVNINEYREPCFKYAIDLEGYDEDVVFVGEEQIKVLEEKEMKKDKEWLKDEVSELYPSYDEMYVSPDYETVAKTETISKVLELIDQLDEPEVKQLDKKIRELESYNDELIRDNNQLRNAMDNQEVLSQKWIDEHTYNHYIGRPFVYVNDLQNLLVPKQEKPVIPQFVADYIELNKGWSKDRQEYVEDDSSGLWSALNGDNQSMPNSVLDWLFNEEKVETFARAWLDGFTIANEDKQEVEENFYTFDNAKKWLQDNGFVVFEKDKLYSEVQQMISETYKAKKEKPVIPKFVAEWFENDKQDMEIEDVFWQIENCEMVNLDVDRWISDNRNTFIRAWLDDYEIEKEPQWVVKDDTGYLSYLQFSIPNIYERETSLDKNDAYKFKSKSKADLIADLVTGTVEEVTE